MPLNLSMLYTGLGKVVHKNERGLITVKRNGCGHVEMCSRCWPLENTESGVTESFKGSEMY